MKAYINNKTYYKCDYYLKYSWPDNTVIKPMYDKDNDNNIINYSFDVYVEKPETIIFSEGESFDTCDDIAWNKYNNYINCTEHEYEMINNDFSSMIFSCKKCGLINIGDNAIKIKNILAETVK